MSLKSRDGVGLIASVTGFSAAANLEVIPAPTAGFELTVLAIHWTVAALATLQLQNVGGTSFWQGSANPNTLTVEESEAGLFRCGDGAALHINNVAVVLYRYNICYETRPTGQ